MNRVSEQGQAAVVNQVRALSGTYILKQAC